MQNISSSAFIKSDSPPKRPSQWLGIILWVIFFIGIILRFYKLGSESLALDEATSFSDCHRPILDLLLGNFLNRSGVNGGFHFLLLRLVTQISTSEFALRFLSAVFGSFSIIFIYYLSTLLINGRRGQKMGVYAAILLTFSPFHIIPSQFTRGYSLLFLLAIGAAIFQVRALLFNRVRDFLGFVVCSILIYNTHVLSIIFIGGQALLVGWYFLFNAENRKRFFVRWSVCYLIIFAGIWKVFLNLQSFFLRVQAPPDQRWWLTKTSPTPGHKEIWEVIKSFSIGFLPESNPLTYLAVILPALFLAGFLSRKVKEGWLRSWEFSFGFFLFIFPLATSFSFSQGENMFTSIYLFYTLPFIYLLAARGLLKIPVRIIPEAILCFSLIAPLFSIHQIFTVPRYPDWRKAVTHILSNQGPNDMVAINANYTHIIFNYYVRNVPPGLRPQVYTMHNYSGDEKIADAERNRIGKEFDEIARNNRRMWLISDYTWETDPLNLVEIEAKSRYRALTYWPGPPRLFLFILTPPPS